MAATDPLLFQGTLLNRNGDAIKDAKIQLWQTDLDGNYLHPDPDASRNPPSEEHASIVSGFKYYGTDSSDSDGHFEFLTYRPGIYTQRPYSHFHFMVWLSEPVNSGDGDEPVPDLITQFYFADENPPFPKVLELEVTKVDATIYTYGSYVNGTIVVDDNSDGVLLPVSPTQAKGPFYPEVNFFSMDNDLTSVEDGTIKSTDPTVSPTPGPFATITGAPTANAANNTGAPTASAITSTNYPSINPAPQQVNSYDTLQASISPTPLQPAQMASPSSAATGFNFSGMVGGFWLLLSSVALRHFM